MDDAHEWHNITRVGSVYAEETCGRTGQRRHRPMRMPPLDRLGRWSRQEIWGVDRDISEWQSGPAPDSNYRAREGRES